jgi:NADPH:quinone reductase-like Zn-dependent oxidoreductase
MVRELGADHVIDYTSADFLATDLRYDLLIDLAGSRTVAECRRVLTPRGVLVAVGGPIRGKWVKPLLGPLRLIVSSMFTSQTLAPFLTRNRRSDLIELASLMESGQVTPVIGRTYPLEEAPAAIGYVGAGHASGKVIIEMAA